MNGNAFNQQNGKTNGEHESLDENEDLDEKATDLMEREREYYGNHIMKCKICKKINNDKQE